MAFVGTDFTCRAHRVALRDVRKFVTLFLASFADGGDGLPNAGVKLEFTADRLSSTAQAAIIS
jgi:hypothetical protein